MSLISCGKGCPLCVGPRRHLVGPVRFWEQTGSGEAPPVAVRCGDQESGNPVLKASKIICHLDVTQTGREQVTSRALGRPSPGRVGTALLPVLPSVPMHPDLLSSDPVANPQLRRPDGQPAWDTSRRRGSSLRPCSALVGAAWFAPAEVQLLRRIGRKPNGGSRLKTSSGSFGLA